MSFELEANPIGLRGAFLTCLSRVSNAWGKSGNFLRLNLYVEAQKTAELELEVANLPPTVIRAGWRSSPHQNTRQKLRDSATNDK